MCCLACCVFSLVKIIVGFFFTDGLEESNSLASVTSCCVVSDVVAVVFFLVVGRFGHR